jgi:ABC-type antimicrobial peptide transport system permease subunit
MILFDAASEGTHVILGMLVVALIFLVTIILGELSAWSGHRRAARRAARREQY